MALMGQGRHRYKVLARPLWLLPPEWLIAANDDLRLRIGSSSVFYGALDADDGVGAQGLVHIWFARFDYDYLGMGGLVLFRLMN